MPAWPQPVAARAMCGPAAFTLIEVLVVVAIIALLVSILLPSLKEAREQSRRSVCLTGLKQIGYGLKTYSADHRQDLPTRDALTYKIWNDPGTGRPLEGLVNIGLLYPKYISRQFEVFFCPSDTVLADNINRWGKNTFLKPNLSSFTNMSYKYAVPIKQPGQRNPNDPPVPRDAGEKTYPEGRLHPAYLQWRDEKERRTGVRQGRHLNPALVGEMYIANQGGLGCGYFSHRVGYNVLYSDFSARFLRDQFGYVARADDGLGCYSNTPEDFEIWNQFSRGLISPIDPLW